MGSTQAMWIGLDLCDGLGWVKFFLTYHGGLGQKIPLTRPMHTPKPNPQSLKNRHNLAGGVGSGRVDFGGWGWLHTPSVYDIYIFKTFS